MVKSLSWIKLLLVLVMVMVSVVTMAPMYSPQRQIEDMSDSSKRNARSANPSSIAAGTVDKIKIIINGRFLEILPNGVVNGTLDENSDNVILHRSSVNPGQVKLEGIATCSFLCMTSCGCLYGSTDEINDECIFNEMLESNHYVSYTSTRYSNENHTFYVALTVQGLPRRVRRVTKTGVGNMSKYVSAFIMDVDGKRIEELEQRKKDLYTNHQHHHLRHRQLCPPPQHAPVKDKSWRCQCKPKKKSCTAGAVDHSDEAHLSAPTKEATAQHSAGRNHAPATPKKKAHSQAVNCKGKKSHKKKSASKHSLEVRSKSAHQAGSEEADEKEATTPVGADDGGDD